MLDECTRSEIASQSPDLFRCATFFSRAFPASTTDTHLVSQTLPQPAYQDNWFAQPPLPNNFNWDVDATRKQWQNNQNSYPSKGWPTYPDGHEIPTAQSEAGILPIADWVPGQEPAWAPIAGGVGFGTPQRSHGPPPGLWPGKSTTNAAAGAGAGGGGSVTNSSTPYANATTSGMLIPS